MEWILFSGIGFVSPLSEKSVFIRAQYLGVSAIDAKLRAYHLSAN
jgi:hypothetical protein